jgi:putative membrane protein
MAELTPMTEAERERVGAAVTAAEAASAGEIVTILTARSDEYRDAALAWAALVALVSMLALALFPAFYLGLIDRVTGAWVQEWQPAQLFEVAALMATIKFAATWLLLQWWPLRLALVPGPVRHARVHARALTCFRVGAERRTTGRTGILIYLSLAEHRAEIVADAAIASKVPAEVWGAALAAMLSELKQDRMAEGLIAAVERVGAVLAEHFPRAADDSNELPDRLIEV